MAMIDEYRKKAASQKQNGGDGLGGDTGSSGSTSSSTDVYQLARDQEYSTLLDKEIQLENAKENASKYANAQLGNSGMLGTGYGSTQKSAIYGQYMNALGNAQNTAQSNISNINLEESQANQEAANDRFESITTMMSSATSKDQMDSLLKDYGYMDEKGEWKTKPEGVSDDDWYQMKYYYNLQKDSLGTADDNFNGSYYTSADALKQGTFDYDGIVYSFGDKYDGEINFLQSKAQSGNVSYGTVIKMKNASGQTIYVKYTKSGFRQASENEFQNSDSKKTLAYEWTSGSDWKFNWDDGDK